MYEDIKDVTEINMCNELVKVIDTLNFSEKSKSAIINSQKWIEAYDKETSVQRTMLIMLFYNILMNGRTKDVVPSRIRLSLNVSTDMRGWLDDMSIVILPYLKLNEEYFF